MESRGTGFAGRIPIALGALIALVCVAGVAAVSGWVALALNPPAAVSVFGGAPECRICGVVEGVRELERAGAPAMALNGDRDESIVMLIAALGGRAARGAARPRTYETAVRFEDGSLRLLRDTRAPQWKAGDRVKVLKGRVEPLS